MFREVYDIMYSITFVCIIYFSIMYTSHTIMDINLISIFKFVFKCALTSFNLFFCVFKTYIVVLIQLVIIKIRFNIFMCSLLTTYFSDFMHEYFINCIVNNIIILLLPVKFLSIWRIVPPVRSMPTFSIIRTKFSRDLTLI